MAVREAVEMAMPQMRQDGLRSAMGLLNYQARTGKVLLPHLRRIQHRIGDVATTLGDVSRLSTISGDRADFLAMYGLIRHPFLWPRLARKVALMIKIERDIQRIRQVSPFMAAGCAVTCKRGTK